MSFSRNGRDGQSEQVLIAQIQIPAIIAYSINGEPGGSLAGGAGDRLDRYREGRSFERGNLQRGAAGFAEARQVCLHRLLFPDNRESFAQDAGCSRMRRDNDFVVHPLTLPSRSHDAGPPQIRQMPRNLGLALSEDLDEIADANLPPIHQIEQPQAGAIGEGRKQQRQVIRLGRTNHNFIIYALTDMSSREYIRLSVCKETHPWKQGRPFKNKRTFRNK